MTPSASNLGSPQSPTTGYGTQHGLDFNKMLSALQENFQKLADVQLKTQMIQTEGRAMTHPSRQQIA